MRKIWEGKKKTTIRSERTEENVNEIEKSMEEILRSRIREAQEQVNYRKKTLYETILKNKKAKNK